MTDDLCLSSLELIGLRSEAGSPQSRAHVRSCARCSALLAALPADAEHRYAELLTSLDGGTAALQQTIAAQIGRAEQQSPEQVPKRRAATRTRTLLLSDYLSEAIEGQDWDLSSLAERAHVSASQLSAICHDTLDLIHRRDTDVVAKVLSILSEDPESVARGPLWQSLLLSSGGLLKGGESRAMLAGSSFAGVSDASREADLFRDQYEVDTSERARREAAELYLSDVLAAL
jgi:hypothetical protein